MKAKATFTLRRLFPGLSDADLQKVQDSSSLIGLRRNQNLFVAGDTPRSMYAVASGSLKIVREGAEGESILTRIVSAGQLLGIREIFGEAKYARTAVALRDSEVFALDSYLIRDLVTNVPSFSLQFMKILCEEISAMEHRVEVDLYRPAKSRVAAVLIELHKLFSNDGELYFEPPVNRRDIAELADVTPETVSRSLADFKQGSLLETHGSAFRFLDLKGLLDEADGR